MIMAMHCISVATAIIHRNISCSFIYIINSYINSSNVCHTIRAATASEQLIPAAALATLIQFNNILNINALQRQASRDSVQK